MLILLLSLLACDLDTPLSVPSPPPGRPPEMAPTADVVPTVAPLRSLGTNLVAPTAPFHWVELDPSRGDLSSQLATECELARRAGQVPIAELSATWCGPCQALRRSLADPLMQDALTGAYVLSLDIDHWGNQLPEHDLSSSGVPMLFALSPDDCSTLELNISGGAWAEDTPANMAPVLKAFVAKARG